AGDSRRHGPLARGSDRPARHAGAHAAGDGHPNRVRKEPIMNVLYTTEALATGEGRDGHVRSDDGRIDFQLAVPKQMGGSGDGAKVGIGRTESGAFGLAVTLEVTLPHVPRAQAQELADRAHQVCPYSNATRGNIDVEVLVTDD